MTQNADRAARRAFIRAHHPDHGGDPGQFIEGLRRLDDLTSAPDGGARPAGKVTIRRRRALARRRAVRWLRTTARWRPRRRRRVPARRLQ